MVGKQLIEININALQEGLDMLCGINDEYFVQSFEPVFQSTMGAHFRHVIEHYQCFLQQLQAQQFCYDERARRTELEINRSLAMDEVKQLICQLQLLDSSDFSSALSIKDMQANGQPIVTNVARELLFLQSHTVHHYAIVAAMSRSLGVEVEGEFGVAIATRAYQKEQNLNQGVVKCAQ